VATWRYNHWAAFFTFTVVIFAAWYLLWMYQRIFFGRAPGELPEPGDSELTTEEQHELAERGLLRTHTATMPVSGGSHAHDETPEVSEHVPSEHPEPDRTKSSPWPDLTLKEFITLAPLAVLTIVVGVYPQPIFHIVEPAFERILAPFLT
jgi:NADH-quinone oxidoreductase subunit M